MDSQTSKDGKVYVGDGVYAERSGNDGIRLTTDPYRTAITHEIYLDWEVWRSLQMWVQAILEQKA